MFLGMVFFKVGDYADKHACSAHTYGIEQCEYVHCNRNCNLLKYYVQLVVQFD